MGKVLLAGTGVGPVSRAMALRGCGDSYQSISFTARSGKRAGRASQEESSLELHWRLAAPGGNWIRRRSNPRDAAGTGAWLVSGSAAGGESVAAIAAAH